MAIAVSSVSVSTTSAALTGTDADGISGESLQFTTPASPVIFVGPPGVTNATGYALAAGTEYFYTLMPGDVLHAVVASGTATVPVLRTSV